MSVSWYQRAFGERYDLVYQHRTAAAAAAEVASLMALVPLRPGARVLDLCCGAGRHARALAAHGLRVEGVDLSPVQLARARAACPAVRFHEADCRALPLADRRFDAVFCLFTSWGYFPTVREDARVLAEAFRVLRPGGTFVLDFLNAARVRATLVPRERRAVPGGTLVIERRLAARCRRVEKTVRLKAPGRADDCWTESVALHAPRTVVRLLKAAGFAVTARYGSLDGEPFDPRRSERFVVRARRRDRDRAP